MEFFAQASTEALAAEAAVQAFQQAMTVERDKTGNVALLQLKQQPKQPTQSKLQ